MSSGCHYQQRCDNRGTLKAGLQTALKLEFQADLWKNAKVTNNVDAASFVPFKRTHVVAAIRIDDVEEGDQRAAADPPTVIDTDIESMIVFQAVDIVGCEFF